MHSPLESPSEVDEHVYWFARVSCPFYMKKIDENQIEQLILVKNMT